MHNIRRHLNLEPQIHPESWVDPTAVIIGDVHLERQVSVWPTVVLRGDQGQIVIEEQTNLQDGTIAHATGGWSSVRVGARCTVGHKVLLHGCQVASDCLIGMGAILLDNCVVGQWSVVGAGSLITANQTIPERSLVLGSPAKVVRQLSDSEIERWIVHGKEEYLKLMLESQRSQHPLALNIWGENEPTCTE